ncbi:MAG: hypothetical protein V4481_05090 [Patescibacteria group bacterium]
MAKLNKSESGAVFAIMDKPGWAALMKLVAMTINDLNARSVPGTNAFETLRSLHIREGKVDALKEFFNGIENGESLSE